MVGERKCHLVWASIKVMAGLQLVKFQLITAWRIEFIKILPNAVVNAIKMFCNFKLSGCSLNINDHRLIIHSHVEYNRDPIPYHVI